jgi:glycosyltransferase involved in cell wall biosynthesis
LHVRGEQAVDVREPDVMDNEAQSPAAEQTLTVTFIVPVYNEEATVGSVLERIEALPLGKQLVIVDDGSTDGTAEILSQWDGRLPTTIIRQPNRGKGAAVRAAIPHITGEIVVIQDADGEYDPADVVFGSRLSGGQPQRAYLFWHLVGNRFLTLLTNILFNTTLSDMETGYKAFRADVLRSLDLRRDDFGIEPEIAGKVCLRHLRLFQIPIAYYGRSYGEGKNITWRDGFKAIGVLLAVRLKGR